MARSKNKTRRADLDQATCQTVQGNPPAPADFNTQAKALMSDGSPWQPSPHTHSHLGRGCESGPVGLSLVDFVSKRYWHRIDCSWIQARAPITRFPLPPPPSQGSGSSWGSLGARELRVDPGDWGLESCCFIRQGVFLCQDVRGGSLCVCGAEGR